MIEKIFLTEKLQDENPYEKLVNEIRSSPDYLNLILEASDPWILQDMNGFILDLSASFADKIGYDPDKLRGRYLQALRAVPLIQRSRLRIVLDRIGEGVLPEPTVFEFMDPEGQPVSPGTQFQTPRDFRTDFCTCDCEGCFGKAG
ncbi:PAS domain S-box protein [Methanothermobacter wolfeii]|uniref:PAS domain S-box protein n=1 Tax=Methanothermobacter wolfeii TaxID=145261 RepID=UPI0024B3BEDB|nr:PAS domain S-box protein [Methanothermobacter wolfeii]MDI6702548.1 PAS domain S-box protein [Methanothermobacter wolfeii]